MLTYRGGMASVCRVSVVGACGGATSGWRATQQIINFGKERSVEVLLLC